MATDTVTHTYGTGGDDQLWGTPGNDYINGGAGDDTLRGGGAMTGYPATRAMTR